MSAYDSPEGRLDKLEATVAKLVADLGVTRELVKSIPNTLNRLAGELEDMRDALT